MAAADAGAEGHRDVPLLCPALPACLQPSGLGGRSGGLHGAGGAMPAASLCILILRGMLVAAIGLGNKQ